MPGNVSAKVYDLIVVGLGAVGVSALYQASLRKRRKPHLKILGLDRYHPPHSCGSSHGETRIYRQAIGEGEFYTPLALRSHEIIRDLELQTGEDILNETGGLIITDSLDEAVREIHGQRDFFSRTVKAAERFNIKHHLLNERELRRRFPHFNFRGGEIGYLEEKAGFIRPENFISAQIQLAQANGAEILTNTAVLGVELGSDGSVEIRTAVGRFAVKKVILSVGPWLNKFLARPLANLFEVHRQTVHWFRVGDDWSLYNRLMFHPVFIWQRGPDFLYGFPAIDGPNGGIKVATEATAVVDPDATPQAVGAWENERMSNFVRKFMPGLGPCLKALSCFYTNTPDRHFVIDRHPEAENIILASPCSGHGFKHAAAVGEALVDLAMYGNITRHNVHPFRLSRFGDGFA